MTEDSNEIENGESTENVDSENPSTFDPFGMDLNDWRVLFAKLGEPGFRATQAFQALYLDKIDTWQDATTLRKELRNKLETLCPLDKTRLIETYTGRDGTKKLAIELDGGAVIEAVVLRSKYGLSLCVSTQVGCPLGCDFCRTGQMGFERNLSAGEIVAQLVITEKIERKAVDNVILMGMGEPMLNLNSVLHALEIVSDPKGRYMSPRRITISTVGYPKKIKDLAIQKVRYNLALSLHFVNDELRRKHMPVAKKQPLKDIFEALDDYSISTGSDVTLEYVLIDGINSSNHDARALAYLAQWGFNDELNNHDYLIDFFAKSGRKPLYHRDVFKVNLLPYNDIYSADANLPRKSIKRFAPPSEERIEEFCGLLLKHGVRATVRRSKGLDINAACGMLGKRSETNPDIP